MSTAHASLDIIRCILDGSEGVMPGLYYSGFGRHAFRRQNVTWRQQVGGATPLEAQRAADHRSLDMRYLYTLTDTERERAQVQAIFDKLMELPRGLTQ